MKTLRSKVVAITGAGSGIGRATAIAMARQGARVSVSDVDQQGLDETVQFCEAEGAECLGTVLDVSQREAVYAWAEATQKHFNQVNVIMNNAGVSLAGVVEDLDYGDFEWIMGINFWGVVYGTKAFLPLLRQSGEGHIVNVSSLFGLMGMPATSAYNASKFAVRGFTESLSAELLIEGAPVAVTSVHPGGIDTNIARRGRIVPNRKWGLISNEQSGKDFKKLARTRPDEAARQIVNAILNNRRRLLIGADAKLFDRMQRLIPARYQSIVKQVVKRQRYAKAT